MQTVGVWTWRVFRAPGDTKATTSGRGRAGLATALLLSAGIGAGLGGEPGRGAKDPTEFSLEDLANIKVTSVSKKETSLEDAPAAVTVITQEDIRRLGITSLPEALRWAPGMDVGRIDSHTWAISARGFESHFANKLLVMIDGRTIYESSFGGVHWDIQDVAMEDLDRIEIVRGPGATLWGANAVNGVINIITRSAKETQGTLISTSVGTEDQPSTTLRYGGQLASNLYYRAYVKYFDRDGLVDSTGKDAMDDWSAVRGGFRLDWEPATDNLLTLQSDYYYTEPRYNISQVSLSPPSTTNLNLQSYNSGGNVLGRWTRNFSDASQISLQAFYTHSEYEIAHNPERADTFDVEMQDRFGLGTWNDILWGAGYRLIKDDLAPGPNLIWTPRRRNMQLFTGFVQDDITVVPDRLHLSLGSKFEHNDFTGFEVQPSGRLLWTPTERQALWASVSRAVRTPDRFSDGARLDVAAFQPGPHAPVFDVALLGNRHLQSEQLIAYEVGYRFEPSKRLSFDLAGFYNQYHQLIEFVSGAPRFELAPPPPHLLLPQNAANVLSGDSLGAEVTAQVQVTERWRLAADYSWIDFRALDNSSQSGSPEQQARLRSYLDLPWHLEFNGAVSYVDGIPNLHVPSYVRLDLGVVWRPSKTVELGLWGQNLIEDRHLEFPSDISSRHAEVPRSVLAKITLRF